MSIKALMYLSWVSDMIFSMLNLVRFAHPAMAGVDVQRTRRARARRGRGACAAW
jgi:hypothetical protein